MKTIDRNGVSLATESFGRVGDPAVVLVMGATASMLGWPDDFCAALAAGGLYVIRFDHRDTGQSTTLAPGLAAYAVEDMAGDVLAVMDGHGVARAHLVGMSLGGYIAQMLALTAPGRVASLTLIASEPLGWDGAVLPHLSDDFLAHFAALAGLDWSDRASVAEFLVTTDRLCAGSGAPFDAAAARVRVERVLDRTTSPASMFNHAAVATRQDWHGAYRRIACPVLVVHGADDPILPVENGRALAAGIPGAGLLVLPGVGHELPARVIEPVTARVAAHVGQTRD